MDFVDPAEEAKEKLCFDSQSGDFTCEHSVECAVGILELIKSSIWDPETAHFLEDAFHRWALEAARVGAPHMNEIARLALSSRSMEFDRWYA